ncbi:hypothetical protein PCE1_004549 [Barthelona sp. PCE]
MPRVRKFEDDLIMHAYPEGQLIFEGWGLILLKSREYISLIESAIEGKDFAGYVEDTGEPLKYIFKLKAGESYMIIDELYDSYFLTHLDILLFNDIRSVEHIRRRIPFPFEMIKSLSSRIIPMDENHLLFTISDAVNFRGGRKCYILNVLTDEYRCLGEYAIHSNINSNINSNYILLRKCQDYTIWHYNFSVDDVDESHEPDIEQLHGVHLEHFRCLNSDCICSVRFRDQEIDELIIFDCQRNQVNLTERFPQLKGLNIKKNSKIALLTLTQDDLSMVFIDLRFVEVIHIENGELKMSEGEGNWYNVDCHSIKHIDLNDNYFCNEDCVFYGTDRRTKRCGPIKFRAVNNEVFRLDSLQPKRIFFDGIAEIYDFEASIRYYFFFKERKLIVLHENDKFSHTRYKILSVQPNEAGDFFVIAAVRSEEEEFYVRIHWNDSESEPIITHLPHCGTEYCGLIKGLPVNVDFCEEDDSGLVYLGEEILLELPPNVKVIRVHDSIKSASAYILCSNAIHFFLFDVNEYDVISEYIVDVCDDEFDDTYNVEVYFNPHFLAAPPRYQLFIVYTSSMDGVTQFLHCYDWDYAEYLDTVIYHDIASEEEGHKFLNFVGDSYIHVRGGIIKAYIEDGAIKTRFFTNNNLPHFPQTNVKQNQDHNLPNNVVQDMSYKKETKTMVLKTYNVEEDPQSMNPNVETFHLPSFMAEASIFEYHVPHYHRHYFNEY